MPYPLAFKQFKMTKAELQAELDAMGVEYDAGATNAELSALIDANQVEEVQAEVAEVEVSEEAEMEVQAEVVEPEPVEEVQVGFLCVGNLKADNVEYKKGERYKLSEEDYERFVGLGCFE